MSTLPTFATLADVPEAIRSFATEEDGKVSLDLVPGSEVVGLKQKVAELLGVVSDTKKKYDGVDVEEFKRMKEAGGKTKDSDARLLAAAEEKAKLVGELTTLRTSMRASAKAAEIVRSIQGSEGAIGPLLEPILMARCDVEEENGVMSVVVRKADGSIRYRDGAGNRFTAADLLKELKGTPEYENSWNVRPASGGGANPGSNAHGGMQTVAASDVKGFRDNIADIASGKVRVV